jgi:hypothetical protein
MLPCRRSNQLAPGRWLRSSGTSTASSSSTNHQRSLHGVMPQRPHASTRAPGSSRQARELPTLAWSLWKAPPRTATPPKQLPKRLGVGQRRNLYSYPRNPYLGNARTLLPCSIAKTANTPASHCHSPSSRVEDIGRFLPLVHCSPLHQGKQPPMPFANQWN